MARDQAGRKTGLACPQKSTSVKSMRLYMLAYGTDHNKACKDYLSTPCDVVCYKLPQRCSCPKRGDVTRSHKAHKNTQVRAKKCLPLALSTTRCRNRIVSTRPEKFLRLQNRWWKQGKPKVQWCIVEIQLRLEKAIATLFLCSQTRTGDW